MCLIIFGRQKLLRTDTSYFGKIPSPLPPPRSKNNVPFLTFGALLFIKIKSYFNQQRTRLPFVDLSIPLTVPFTSSSNSAYADINAFCLSLRYLGKKTRKLIYTLTKIGLVVGWAGKGFFAPGIRSSLIDKSILHASRFTQLVPGLQSASKA